MSKAGEQKSIKNLRSGDLLIQCAKESHEESTTDEDILWSQTQTFFVSACYILK